MAVPFPCEGITRKPLAIRLQDSSGVTPDSPHTVLQLLFVVSYGLVKNNYLYKYNTFLKLSRIFDRTVGIARRLLDRMKVVRRKMNLAICDSYGLSSVECHLTIKFSKKGVAL